MAETFAQLGRVEAVRQLFEGSGFKPFEEPLWFTPSEGETVTTALKMLLEGIDFNLEYFPLKHLGYKSAVAVTGELYAVLSRPETLSLTLGISAKLEYDEIKEFWDGVAVAAKEHGYSHLSLDLAPSKNGLSISLCAVGRTSAKTNKNRPVAHSRDLICVSGSLGAAYLGQQVLEHKREELEKYKMLVAAYLKPELDPLTVAQLEDSGIVPSFGYFVSRGLSDAVMRLSRDSGLGAKVYAEKIPFEGNSFALGREMDIDPISASMNGGDDYRLLFTVPIASFDAFRKDFHAFDVIGHLALSEVGSVLVTPDGLEHPLSAQGWPEQVI